MREKSGHSKKKARSYGVKLVRGPFVQLAHHVDTVTDEEGFLSLCESERRKGPLAANLFCGAGGLSMGLAEAGFRVVFGADSDREAIRTHSHALPGWHVEWDLSEDAVVERIAGPAQRHKARQSITETGHQ